MKKLLLLLPAIALLAACKKNSSAPKEILLSKVIVNGEPEAEFIYNNDLQLTEERYFENNQLSYKALYTYDASGKLKEMNSFNMPGNAASGRYVFTLDAQGRILRNAIYSISGTGQAEFSTYIDHEYNSDGRLAKQSWRDENEELGSYRVLTYYPNGNMRTSESFWMSGLTPEKKFGSAYGASDTTLPASFSKIKAFPVNYYYNDLVAPYLQYYTYDDGQVKQEYKEVITGRKFNAKGLVIQQTVTTKHIKPVSPDEVREMQYQYVEK